MAKKGSESAAIKVSPQGGFFEKPFVLSLKIETSVGCMIRYTLDGSEPSQTGQPYVAPLLLSNTVVFRSAAFRSGERISPIATHTYLFLESIIHQTNNPPGYPVGTNAWNGYPSDYDMSPVVVNDPAYRSRIKDGLRALPALSVAVGPDALFGPDNGIYLHSQERGESWERSCSAEMFLSDGSRAFQIDCGLRIQGNSNRIPEKTPKRSFRLIFRPKFGATKLHYRIFPNSAVDTFETFDLRAEFNNSWVHWNPVSQVRGQRIRDAWLKDSQRAVGGLASHTRFVHLYLNGLYWGVYDLTERPDAAFASSYLGGKKQDFDIVNELQAKNGQLDEFNSLMAMTGLTNIAQYQKLQRLLDVPAYIDYLLVNYYAGNFDWGEAKNWYAIGDRRAGGQFRYLCWDGEFILQDLADNVVGAGAQPFHLLAELRNNPEFMVLMGDRIQKHFFGAGALTPSAASDRWMRRAQELDLAIIAESARWGDYRRSPPYTRDKDWIAEQQRLLATWFPQRTAVVLQQLRDGGLYPAVNAPELRQANSPTNGSIEIAISASTNSSVYVTTNGADPRVPTQGTADPKAFVCTNSLRVHPPAVVKARSRQGAAWSALVELVY